MENVEQDTPERVPPHKGGIISGNNIGIALVIALVTLVVAFVLVRDTTVPTFGELGRTVTLSGTVATIDAESLTLVLISSSKKEERTIHIESETRIYRDLAGGERSSLVEINLTDLTEGEEVNIIYDSAVDDAIFGVETIIVYDPRSFDEYRTTVEPLSLLPATLTQLEKGVITVSFALPIAGEEGNGQFPVTLSTTVWRVSDATRAHITHTRKEAVFAELAIGGALILEFNNGVVFSIIIISKEN